jgi:predicted HAD superfamily phosphohydrolase YqeG
MNEAGYELLGDEGDIPSRIRRLAPQTVIVDVEPLVASWDSTQHVLDQGLVRMVGQIQDLPTVRVLCFATNSDRLPSALPSGADLRVQYEVSARKPLHIEPYLDMPRPGVVIGDQIATDGILARRLGFTFLHFRPRPASMPAGPRLLSGVGDLLLPIVFSRRA